MNQVTSRTKVFTTDRPFDLVAGIRPQLMFMKLEDTDIGPKYICDYDNAQYYGFVEEKSATQVRVKLTDKIDPSGGASSPIDRLGTLNAVWVAPESIHEM